MAIRAGALVPQIREILEQVIVRDDERWNVDARSPFAIVARYEGAPTCVRAFDEQATTEDFDLSNHCWSPRSVRRVKRHAQAVGFARQRAARCSFTFT